MSVKVNPSVYITWRPKGSIEVAPAICITWIPRGTLQLSEDCKVFITFVPPEPQQQQIHADTSRKIAKQTKSEGDTKRRVAVKNVITADTSRLFGLTSIQMDTLRQIAKKEQQFADSVRRVQKKESCSADVCRLLGSLQEAIFDTCRYIGDLSSISVDLKRQVSKIEQNQADMFRHIPYLLRYSGSSLNDTFHESGIHSFYVTLGELTLSDTFRLETARPLKIAEMVEGNLLDYHFCFLVEETSQRDLLQSVKGMYSKDDLLYKAININFASARASYYLQGIAEALGVKLDMQFDDFTPSQDYSDSNMTYQDLISALFGWTAKLPQRQINVFLRNDVLSVIQRGKEKYVLDITDWPHGRPTIERKFIRSLWFNGQDGDNQAHNEKETEPVPFTGTIALGAISRTYENGFLVQETNEEGTTIYAYADGYLMQKRTHNKDGSTSLTEYSYAKTNRDIYLFKERERTTEAVEGATDHNDYDWTDWSNEKGTERITYHAPLGLGWYATTVYVDGENAGSTLSQGKPGGKASQYTIDQSNLSLNNKHLTASGRNTNPDASSLIDTEFPIYEEDYLAELTKAINWLHRKTQETVTLEIISHIRDGVPEIQHIVDFTELIRFQGNEYFLVSNQVALTPRSFQQTITMTRWYE